MPISYHSGRQKSNFKGNFTRNIRVFPEKALPFTAKNAGGRNAPGKKFYFILMSS